MTDPFNLPNVVRDGDVVPGVPFYYAASQPCHGCGDPTRSGAQVCDPWRGEVPVCGTCAVLDDRLMPWQVLADAVQAIDAAMVAADGREARQWFADHLAGEIGYMATWRWPGEPVEPRPIHD